MASNSGTTVFPGGLDDYANPLTTTYEDDVGYSHVTIHTQVHAAIEAIEVTVGTTAGTGVLTNFASGDLAARVNSETFGTPAITEGTATDFNLHNPIIGTPAISAGTATTLNVHNAVIGTPAITGGTATDITLSNPTGNMQTKVGNFTYDVSTATGDLAITGVGFKPKAIILIGIGASATTDKISWGMADGALTEKTMVEQTGPTYVVNTSKIFSFYHYGGAGNYVQGVLKTLDADGFTLTITKTGTPTGTAAFIYLAFG